MKIGYLNNIIQRIPIKRPCRGYYLRWWYNGWHYWFFLPGNIVQNTYGEQYNTIGTRKIAMGSGQISHEQVNALRTIRNSREIQLLTDVGWMNLRIEPGTVIVKNNYINGYEFDFVANVGSREPSITGFSPVEDIPETPFAGYDKIYITHHNPGTFVMILTGHGDIIIDWGDGTPPETYTLTDTPLVITHTYVDGEYEHTITIDGEENIETLTADGQFITEIIIPETATSLTELHLPNNELTDVVIPDTVPLEILDLENNPLAICEVIIGSQIWMCKNYDSDFPGSKVYNNDEANRAIYGGLYTWNQIMTTGFCPPMWHIPALAEWIDLITYLGGDLIAGGHLKEIGITHWNAPNTGADDNVSFTALGAGDWNVLLNIFERLLRNTYLWTADEYNANMGMMVYLSYNSAAIFNIQAIKGYFFSVRLIKNFSYAPASFGVLTDYDGNIYTYITIGTQQWIVQNLKTTHYADGTPIPNLTLAAAWAADAVGAYCWYNNDIGNKTDYGALYNWFAVDSIHGLPYFERNGVPDAGWRVPLINDWDILINYIGGAAIAGGKLKEIGTTHWNAPNTGATDDYGFKGLPGGFRAPAGGFGSLNLQMILAAADLFFGNYYNKYATNATINLGGSTSTKNAGFSIRCMRDVP